jgi:hypothetical protein
MMDYDVDMQVGYYEDDDTYHGPFPRKVRVRARSLDEAIRDAKEILQREKQELGEPEGMADGAILAIHDGTGRLCFSPDLRALAQEADRTAPDQQAGANVLARLKGTPSLVRGLTLH